MVAQRRARVGLPVLCNEEEKKKKEHLFQMEIRGWRWDKLALPQCGRGCMQGDNLDGLRFMQMHTTCVSSECQRI